MSDTAAPHLQNGENSPLSFLAQQALRRFGDFATDTIDATTAMMFIEFANLVIDDVRRHPYWSGDRPPYYRAFDEIGTIPDSVMIAGLLAHYATQQGSQKASVFIPMYHRTMNGNLYELRYSNSKLEIEVKDKTQDGYVNR